VAQLGRPAAQHRDEGADAVGGTQEVRDRVHALRKDVRAHPRLVVQQRALVRVGGRGVHAGAEVDVDALVAVLALDEGGGGVGAPGVLGCVATTVGGAQEPPSPPPPPWAPGWGRAESSLVPPPPPSPEQKRFLDGLRTATRAIAQLKDGLNRVTRTQSKGDSVSQRRAGRLLAGLCGSARAFMGRGRPYMKPAVYEDSTRLKARRLTTQMDSLISYTTSCEQ